MHISKFFNCNIHRDSSFRNPYIYLKEEELNKLQKQKELSELKLSKEKRQTQDLKDKQIILALDNLNYTVSSKGLSDTRKKVTKKRRGLVENIFPAISSSSKQGSNKEIYNGGSKSGNMNEGKRVFRFLTSYKSKSSINSCLTSLCTKDSNGSDYTDVDSAVCKAETRNKSEITTDTNNTSVSSSVIGLKFKDSITSLTDAGNMEYLLSCDYLTIGYFASNIADNHSIDLDDVRTTLVSSIGTRNTINPPSGLSVFPGKQDIVEITTASNMLDSMNPFVKTICITDATSNTSRGSHTIDGDTIGSNTHESTCAHTEFNSKAERFYHSNGSIALPKANSTDSQLNSFRRKYHKYPVNSKSLRFNSSSSDISKELDSKSRFFKHCLRQSSGTLDNIRALDQSSKVMRRLHYNIENGDHIHLDYVSNGIEEFESSSIYDSEPENYYGQDYLIS